VRDGAEAAITVRPRLVVSNPEAAFDAVRAGIGRGRGASYYVGAAIKAGTLTTVLDEFHLPTRPVSFIYHAGRFIPIKLRVFLDFAAPRLKARLA
jgi:DNA-binding transcriptional LysR family regulator